MGKDKLEASLVSRSLNPGYLFNYAVKLPPKGGGC
jgi:hypothetical protein